MDEVEANNLQVVVAELSAELTARAGLQECVLRDLEWLHWGSVIRLSFEYFWQDVEGELRLTPEALNHPGVVELTASWMLAMNIDNAPTASMVGLRPDEMTWGYSEVAVVEVVADTYAAEYLPESTCLRLEVHWEGERRITIWCRDLAIETTRAPGLAGDR